MAVLYTVLLNNWPVVGKLGIFLILGSVFSDYIVFRSSPTDDRVDLNSNVSVRPHVRPQKVFSDFHLIWCVDRPRPHMCTSVTSTRSKVKVKVMELPRSRKLHFSRSISSAVLACSSKLMVGGDSTDMDYRLSEPDFWTSFQESYHETSNFVQCQYFTKFKSPYFCRAQNWWLVVIVWDLVYSLSEPDFRLSF